MAASSQHDLQNGGLFRWASHYSLLCNPERATRSVDTDALHELADGRVFDQIRALAEAEIRRREMSTILSKRDVAVLPKGAIIRVRPSNKTEAVEWVIEDGALKRAGKRDQMIEDLRDFVDIYRPFDVIELVSVPKDVPLSQRVVDLLPAGTTVKVKWSKRAGWQHEVIGKDGGNLSYTTRLNGDGQRSLAARIGFVGYEAHRNNVKLVSMP